MEMLNRNRKHETLLLSLAFRLSLNKTRSLDDSVCSSSPAVIIQLCNIAQQMSWEALLRAALGLTVVSHVLDN